MEILPGAGAIQTRACLGDCQLHLEWAAPVAVTGAGQERGNSGVLLMSVYEMQILDGYENPTYPDGAAAALDPRHDAIVARPVRRTFGRHPLDQSTDLI